jgi:hypothetical protein
MNRDSKLRLPTYKHDVLVIRNLFLEESGSDGSYTRIKEMQFVQGTHHWKPIGTQRQRQILARLEWRQLSQRISHTHVLRENRKKNKVTFKESFYMTKTASVVYGQSSWLQTKRSGFDSRSYQIL